MRVYLWLAKIGKQPFTLRGTAITFTPNVNEVLLTLGRRTTNFDQSYTPQVLDAVRAWARQPFHMDKATFDATVLTPFQQAGDSYRRLRRRKTAGKASAMDGLGLRLAAWSKLLKFAEE